MFENKLQKKLQFALFNFCFYSKYRPITKQMADLITIGFCSLNLTDNLWIAQWINIIQGKGRGKVKLLEILYFLCNIINPRFCDILSRN